MISINDYYVKINVPTINEMEKFEDKTRESIECCTAWFLEEVIGFVCKCQSPIERLLATTLYSMYIVAFGLNAKKRDMLRIYPQYEINFDDNKYRVDFYIEYLSSEGLTKIVVECDGHDYHEKTKEQAQKDKSRDRNLTKAGYKVLRFTGSEIFNNPDDCVVEIGIAAGIKFKKQ